MKNSDYCRQNVCTIFLLLPRVWLGIFQSKLPFSNGKGKQLKKTETGCSAIWKQQSSGGAAIEYGRETGNMQVLSKT